MIDGFRSQFMRRLDIDFSFTNTTIRSRNWKIIFRKENEEKHPLSI